MSRTAPDTCGTGPPRPLAGEEVGEDTVHLLPQGQAGAACIRAPWLQGAIRELVEAGLGVCWEAWLGPVQQAAPDRTPRRGTGTSALHGPWKQSGHVNLWPTAGQGAEEARPSLSCPAWKPLTPECHDRRTSPLLLAVLETREDP